MNGRRDKRWIRTGGEERERKEKVNTERGRKDGEVLGGERKRKRGRKESGKYSKEREEEVMNENLYER